MPFKHHHHNHNHQQQHQQHQQPGDRADDHVKKLRLNITQTEPQWFYLKSNKDHSSKFPATSYASLHNATSLPAVNTFEFLPDLFKNQIENSVNKRMSTSPTNCIAGAATKTDLINAACSTTQNVTLSANFNEQRIRTKHSDDHGDDDDNNDGGANSAKEVNVDINLQQVSKRTRKRSFNYGNNKAEEDKVSLTNYNSNNENFSHENDDANGSKCFSGQTNEVDYVSRHGGMTGLEKDLNLKNSDELLTNNNGKQQTQSSVIVGSLKVRDEFIESKSSQSYTKNLSSDAADSLQQFHMHHHSIKMEEEVVGEEKEEGNNTVRNRKSPKRSRSRSRSHSPISSNNSIILTATNSNHSIVHNVGGSGSGSGSISKDKTTLRKHHEKHTTLKETEKFAKIKDKITLQNKYNKSLGTDKQTDTKQDILFLHRNNDDDDDDDDDDDEN
ncbi:hypothetical protein DOY81_001697 [Sarcophaga bullata]|nr:hypothetical protein DOY81_001697 [Sarcophaga bullata]